MNLLTLHWPGEAKSMRRRIVIEGLVLGGLPLALTWALKPALAAFWQTVIAFWGDRLGGRWAQLPLELSGPTIWSVPNDGTTLPSSSTLLWTWLGVCAVWTASLWLSDRFHPLKVFVRALCLVQGCACLFFMWSPSSFPYTLSRHVQALLDMGYGLMLATGPMLALGWGLFVRSVTARLLTPLAVLAYFSLMLPHKALLHAWLIDRGSALFMPVLFLCFGIWLDGWMFIALYGWLTSRIPREPAIAKLRP